MASSVGPFAGAVESFENVTDNTANGTGAIGYGNNFTIGNGSVTTFASGVTFTAPLITGGNYFTNGDPFISDFSISTFISNQWGSNGNVNPSNVPGGTAWVGTFVSATENGDSTPRTLQFTLPYLPHV